jgi:hypothetical protein
VELDQNIFKFLEIYERRRNEILQKRPTNWEYPASVATTWSLSFECIRNSNPNAALCLNLFAFLNPDGIIPSFLEDAAVLLEDNIGPLQLFKSIMTDSFLFSQALAELGRYSLISRHREASIIAIHGLVQAVLQDNMDLKEQTTFRKIVVDLIWAALPESEGEYHSKAMNLESQISRPLLEMVRSSYSTEKLAEVLQIVGLIRIKSRMPHVLCSRPSQSLQSTIQFIIPNY